MPAEPRSRRVLGIDPGLSDTGYGLIGPGDGALAVLATGVISTLRDLRLEDRIQLIYTGVDELLAALSPELVVLEDLYAEYRFPRTALLMAHARGVICLAARQRHVDILALAPGEVKRAVTGNGRASKEQVQHSVQRLLALGGLPRPSHVADALALAFTGYSRMGGRLT
ncbi:MAG: crossover junction endodeoxyribonuclease RuvC [Candidatus Rokubacteria bacterium]|nr:crossover junction endodeoxyribonuclease RuvC [Candidatus Rokubacteria bacterium]